MLSKEQADSVFQKNPELFQYSSRELNEEEVKRIIDKLSAYKQEGKTLADDFLKSGFYGANEAEIIAKNVDKIRRTIWRDYLQSKRQFSLFYFNERNVSEVRKQFSEKKQVYIDLILYLNKWMKNIMSNEAVKNIVMEKRFSQYAVEGH